MTSGSRSNDNGRSLEYLIALEVAKIGGCATTERATRAQVRDSSTICDVDTSLVTSFRRAAALVALWISRELGLGESKTFTLDRTSDSDLGVADLIIATPHKTLPVSIKHNHDALSHPRPYSIVDAIGFGGLQIDLDHRNRLGRHNSTFRREAGGATTFKEVPAAKLKLYRNICEECRETLSTLTSNKTATRALFDFLVGGNFFKVRVETDLTTKRLKGVSVVDYSKVPQPTKFTVSVDNRSRASSVILTFDNGWEIDLRLKNASSRISSSGQLSLKFDAQRIAGHLPPQTDLLD